MTAYQSLERIFARARLLGDATGILEWDSQTLMPDGAAANRAEQLALLKGMAHDLLAASATGDLLAEAEDRRIELDDWHQANLREMRHRYLHATAVPHDLVVASSKADSEAEMVWREARRTSDFALLRPYLESVLALQRHIGAAKGAALGLSVYDALLDSYDPGMRQARIDPLFSALRHELPSLVAEAQERQRRQPAPLPIAGDFPVLRQKQLGEALMRRAGFDFAHGRLDISLHPFCGGATGDVRITTRYDERDFTRSVMAVLHETGHALYEQGLPAAFRAQPVGMARGMMLHESQSLLIEMQACRTPEFIGFLAVQAQITFERRDPALSAENLRRLYTRVEPGFIRVDADEITYPAHILLRYGLELAMISGDLPLAELPDAFNAGLKGLLGLTVPNDAQGCLQDIHWPSGSFGYFPTYTLGAMVAAQLYEAALAAEPTIPAALGRGDFGPLLGWLRRHVHARASLLDSEALLFAASGRPLGSEAYRRHLQRRYLG